MVMAALPIIRITDIRASCGNVALATVNRMDTNYENEPGIPVPPSVCIAVLTQLTSHFYRSTVFLDAKERGVQHCSLASFLIFLIPANSRSYLHSIRSSETYKFCTQNALKNHIFPNLFVSSNFQPRMF